MRKRLIFAFVFISVLISQIQISVPVFASSAFNTSCGANLYSVDRITGQDQFTNLACYNENQYADALARMQSEAASSPNVVVRHPESPSPMKIVAADRAMAYSQNDTYLRISTINVYRNKELTTLYTYINQSNPLYYYGTHIKTKAPTDTIKPSDLSANIEVNAAKGFIDLRGIDIIPLIYVENRWLITYKTRLLDEFRESRIYANITSYTVSDVTSTTKTGLVTVRQLSIRIDNALTASTNHFGVAPDWLANGTYYSPDGIHFYTDMDLKNPVLVNGTIGKYYNYYNYINLRSKSEYTGNELDEYFDFYFSVNRLDPASSVMRYSGSIFVNAQNTYGMNALMIYAMAIHESAYGRSNYAVNRNNLFGYNAFDSSPDSASYYASVQQAVDQHMGLNLRYYLDANNLNTINGTSLFYGSNIGTKGAGINTRYASDPFWSVKISGFAFRMDRYLGFKDLNKYSIAILGLENRTFYKDNDLQNTAFSINSRAENYPNIVLASNGGKYTVQSTNPIQNGNIITSSTSGLVEYNWSNSIVYISQQNLTIFNTPINPIHVSLTEDVLLNKVVDFRWLNDYELYIKGRAILNETPMDDITQITHTLTLKSIEEKDDIAVSLTPLAESFNNFNGLVYNAVGFEGTIDFSTIPYGSYLLELKTQSRDTTGISILREPALNPVIPDSIIVDSALFKIVLDSWNTMEYLITKTSLMPDLTISRTLPSEYTSVARIYSISIDDTKQLSLQGLGYINKANIGADDDKSFKLILANLNTGADSYSFIMTPTTGSFNPSLSPYDYSYAWFDETIDLSLVADGEYKLFLYIKANTSEDIVEIRDFSFKGDIAFENSTHSYLMKLHLFRRNYDLIINEKITITP